MELLGCYRWQRDAWRMSNWCTKVRVQFFIKNQGRGNGRNRRLLWWTAWPRGIQRYICWAPQRSDGLVIRRMNIRWGIHWHGHRRKGRLNSRSSCNRFTQLRLQLILRISQGRSWGRLGPRPLHQRIFVFFFFLFLRIWYDSLSFWRSSYGLGQMRRRRVQFSLFLTSPFFLWTRKYTYIY